MSVRTDVLLWAQRIVAKKGAAPHLLLEVPAHADLAAVQDAFHKIARMAHPDLHRTQLAADELELVTSAYAHVAAAYASMRSAHLSASRLPSLNDAVTQPMSVAPSGPLAEGGGGAAASSQMSGKALVYFRKAELCLRRGELKGAVLQLKLAIAADPASTFLRAALAEVEPATTAKR